MSKTDHCRCVNEGALSGIATTFMEKDVGYWAAFLMPTSVFALGVIVFHFNQGRYGAVSLQQSTQNRAFADSKAKLTDDRRGQIYYLCFPSDVVRCKR